MAVTRPLVCLVTDRRRLAGRSGSAPAEALVDQVAAAAGAGIDLLQIREPDLPAAELLDLTTRCLRAIRGTGARLVVNDRLDVAVAAGAAGVHLRSDAIAASRARAVAPPGFLVGRSVHDEAEALTVARMGGVDYLIAGTLFDTDSKPAGQARLGLEAFGRIARESGVPVLGIGGVTLERALDVVRAGGAGVAAIGLFLPGPGADAAAGAFEAVRRLRALLDAASVGDRSDTLGPDHR